MGLVVARRAVRHLLRPAQHHARRQHRPGREARRRQPSSSPARPSRSTRAIGPRTTNRGFDYAPVIAADNVLRQGVGGGICQYATTLFNAVLFAGLPVVEREAHSLYISHYPIGRDATVAWGAVDFKFRNDTGKTLMIRSWVEGDHLTVALVGKTGREVDLQDQRLLRYSQAGPRQGGPARDLRRRPRPRRDPLGAGHRRTQCEGRAHGARRAGLRALPRQFVSRYEPLDWVKRVGT